jgi:hypothetical protein
MESAHRAAVTCDEVFRLQQFEEPFLARYEGRWRQRFHEDFHYADLLVSLPCHRIGLSNVFLWVLRRMSRRGLVDKEYARMITGFFCGVIPRKKALRMRFVATTLLG